jgi:hypothetical protein
MGKISNGGWIRAKVCSRSSLFIEHSRPMVFFHSLGKVSRDPRLLLEWRFLFERRFGVRSLPWIILGGGVWWW